MRTTARTGPAPEPPSSGTAGFYRSRAGRAPRSAYVWPILVILSGCSLGEAPPPAPAEPAILAGPPIREGLYTDDEARSAAQLLTQAEGDLAASRLQAALDAARRVEQSFPTAPGSSGALWVRARALRDQGDWAGAVEAAEAFASLLPPGNPGYGEAYLFEAEVRRDGGLPGAIESVFDVPESSPEAVLAEADSLAAVWASGLETSELRDLVDEAPRHPRILPAFETELAVRLYLSGDEVEAGAIAQEALGMSPGPEVSERARSVIEGRVEEEVEVAAVLGGILPTTGSPSISRLARELSEGVEVALAGDEQEYSRPVRFVPIEDTPDPAEMRGALIRLEGDGVAGVIGPLQDQALAAAASSRNELIPLLSPTATVLPAGAEGVFSLNGVDPGEGEALSDLVLSRGAREVVVLYAASPEMEEELRWFSQPYTSGGGRIVRTLGYPPGSTSFESVLGEAVRARPAGLVLLVPPEDVELLAPQVAFYGVDQLPGLTLFGNSSWTSGAVLDAVQARSIEGVFAVTSWIGEDEFGPGWDQFKTAYEEHFRRSLRSPTPALGYDAARLLLRAAREGGGTPEGTLRALEQIQGFPGATGFLSVIDGRIRRTYVPVRIENRRPVLVDR